MTATSSSFVKTHNDLATSQNKGWLSVRRDLWINPINNFHKMPVTIVYCGSLGSIHQSCHTRRGRGVSALVTLGIRMLVKYSGDLTSELVRYLNGPK